MCAFPCVHEALSHRRLKQRSTFTSGLAIGRAILFSHPKDFTPVCTTELGCLASLKDEFAKRDTKVICLGIDPVRDRAKSVSDPSGTPVSRKPEKMRLSRCEKLVELSGYCPPSPRNLTGAFSRLSLGFVLVERTPRSAAYRSLQILYLARASNHALAPARVCDRSAEWFGPTLCVR